MNNLSWKQRFREYLLEYDEDDYLTPNVSFIDIVSFDAVCIGLLLLYGVGAVALAVLSPIWGIPYLIYRFVRKERDL